GWDKPIPAFFPGANLVITGSWKWKLDPEKYNIYFDDLKTAVSPQGKKIVTVNVMLWSEYKYYQVTANINFNPELLEIDEDGYDYLRESVAAYEIVEPGTIKVWSFYAPHGIIEGDVCDPAVVIASLRFTLKDNFVAGSETKLTITEGFVNPPGSLSPPLPEIRIGPAVTVKSW
ncbi:MAG: cohesin domain-containing protein, partial [Clostridiales bacterium]|nr:cohesin domain-containing protein [Clostridiales bacterium]